MSTEVAVKQSTGLDFGKLEQVLIKGDLSVLNDKERVGYYRHVCETVGLNPATKPFEYIQLNGKLVLYGTKGCAEQLRNIHKISIRITNRQTIEGVYVVTAAAQGIDGRVDESTGAVQIAGLKGETLANAMMKAETKAKRRVTLSICGLNMLDETEVESIPPQSKRVVADKPGDNDGVKGYTDGIYRIPKGSFAKLKISEVSEPDLRGLKERLECEPSLEHWELTLLDRVNEYLVTLDNLDPQDEDEIPTERGFIKCGCGSDLKYSDRKGVYYCPQFNTAGDHIKPVQKAEYEMGVG